MELFSPGHLVVLLIVVGIVFFGWKQLPDMARSAGRSLRVFRTEVSGVAEAVAAPHVVATNDTSTASPNGAGPRLDPIHPPVL